ncbi:type II secretion system protein GspM [Variovorax sp. OV329]|uniref:type II secretion system protein GspM n=1 Tax=Variovorax sp. OV329 TaxID=1882825 RepID=UPI0008E91175|nr:type II secretion system protein GspM [Variovorax sp. OV329]SFM16866.1 general secretion pathway protein M [Variovorax sp. OV329]
MREQLAQLRARWAALDARERRLVGIAAALIGVALLWWIAFAPAIKTLRDAPAEHARLDAQLQQMTTLQAQAKALQSQPRANRDESMKALEASVKSSLGPTAQIQQQGGGEAVNVVVRAVPAEALAQWLAQARGNARAVPREVHLTRAGAAAPGGGPAPSNPAAAANDGSKANWDGTLGMTLPAAR